MLLTALTDIYTPTRLVQELERHLSYMAEKRGVDRQVVREDIELITKAIRVVPDSVYQDKMKAASELTKDPADRYFTALALYLAEEHGGAVILTYNKKDYREGELRERRVEVMTPAEAVAELLR